MFLYFAKLGCQKRLRQSKNSSPFEFFLSFLCRNCTRMYMDVHSKLLFNRWTWNVTLGQIARNLVKTVLGLWQTDQMSHRDRSRATWKENTSATNNTSSNKKKDSNSSDASNASKTASTKQTATKDTTSSRKMKDYNISNAAYSTTTIDVNCHWRVPVLSGTRCDILACA